LISLNPTIGSLNPPMTARRADGLVSLNPTIGSLNA